MLTFENTTVYGFAEAIRGMRNPMESHDKIDSREKIHISFDNIEYNYDAPNPLVASIVMKPATNRRYTIEPLLSPNDLDLMERLVKAGTEHAKFMRMITVYCDITGPLYWWKEFDTYKIGTVANSYSTMHKIQENEFTIDMFSHEHLKPFTEADYSSMDEISPKYDLSDMACRMWAPGIDPETAGNYVENMINVEVIAGGVNILSIIIDGLNFYRKKYLETGEKKYWWQMIQLLPSSWNQKRTIMMNYQVLSSIYHQRKSHKLDEWRIDFMKWIDTLPYSDLIKLETK